MPILKDSMIQQPIWRKIVTINEVGIGTQYDEEKYYVREVAPPGFGHTKSGKGDKKGGTAAAFDRARKEGRFKGSKSDMFAIMWSQKNKGDKPHYKPGTNKKYKKYQEETSMPNIKEKDRGAINKRFKGLFKKDIKGTVQGVNETSEYEKLKEKIGSKEKHDKPAYKDFVKKARKK